MEFAIKAVLIRKGARNGVIRRFSIPEDVKDEKYKFVKTKVAELFTELEEGATTELQWKDEDGDMVVFSSEEEIQEAIKSITEDGTLLIHVTEIKQKKTTQPVLCKECEEPVTGPRYVCTVCPDYNLCDTCEAAGHHPDHDMIKMVTHDMEKEMEFPVNSDGEFVPPPRFRRWMNRFTRRWHQRNGCLIDTTGGKGEDLDVEKTWHGSRSLRNKGMVGTEQEGRDKSPPRRWRRRMRIALQGDSDGSRCMGRRRHAHLSDQETGEETSPIRGCNGGHQRRRHCSRQGWGRRMRCGNGGWRRRARMMTEKEDMGVGFESEGRSRPSQRREDISIRRRNGRCQPRRMRRAMSLPNLRVRMEAEAPRRGRSLSRRCLKRMRLIRHGENVEGYDRSTRRCRRRIRLLKDAKDGEQGRGRSFSRRCRRRMRLMKEAQENGEEGCDRSNIRCKRRIRLSKDAEDGEQERRRSLSRRCRRRMRLMKEARENGVEGCDRSTRRCRRRMRLLKDAEDGKQGRGRSFSRRCRRRMRLMKEAQENGGEGCDRSNLRCRRRMRLSKDAEDGEQERRRSFSRRCRRRMRLMKEAGENGVEGCDRSTLRCRRRMRLLKDEEDGEQGRGRSLSRRCRRRMRLMREAGESCEEGCNISTHRCRRRMRLLQDAKDGEQGCGRPLTRRCKRRMMMEADSDQNACDVKIAEDSCRKARCGDRRRFPEKVRFARKPFLFSEEDETAAETPTQRGWGKRRGGKFFGGDRPLRGGRKFWRRLSKMMKENAQGKDDSGLHGIDANRLFSILQRMQTRVKRRQFRSMKRQNWRQRDVPTGRFLTNTDMTY